MKTIHATLFALCLACGAAQAAGPTGTSADYGQAVSGNVCDRVVNIDAGTRYVNVENGETIKFNVQGKSFTWHFAAFPNRTVVSLQRIAPACIRAGAVQVYIASDPLYRG